MKIQGDLFNGRKAAAGPDAPAKRDRDGVRARQRQTGPAVRQIRLSLPKLLIAAMLFYFLFTALLGENGLAQWSTVRLERDALAARLATLTAERERLTRHAALLDPAAADPDLVEELVRRDLGLMRPDEIVIATAEPHGT